jgi:hypothetical protein
MEEMPHVIMFLLLQPYDYMKCVGNGLRLLPDADVTV